MPDFEIPQGLNPEIDKTIDFLKKWKKDGDWILTGIPVDTITYTNDENDLKYIHTRTFGNDNIEELKQWLLRRNGRCNLYFQVNDAIMTDENGNKRVINKKTLKTDIEQVSWLHVDIDPEGIGEKAINEERQEVYQNLMKMPDGIPDPTVIIFSGGGFQAFWKLENPIQIDGDVGKAEDAERYNIQLRILLNGDESCHNVDRIMRLPYMVNIPNKRKVDKGRVPQLSSLVRFETENVYNISKFVPAPSIEDKRRDNQSKLNPSPVNVNLSGNIQRVTDLHAIKDENGAHVELPPWMIEVIKNGYDENAKQDNDRLGLKFKSKSEAVFSIICTLVRRNISDETIFAIITDKNYGISEHVFNQRGRWEKYALRQIERAKDYVIDPALAELNDRHAVILNDGGKCVVITEEYKPDTGQWVLNKSQPKELSLMYANRLIQIGETQRGDPKFTNIGKWWFEDARRRQYKGVVMIPERDVAGYYNTWRGFSYEPIKGDCSLLLQHIHENICQGEDRFYEYLIKWMARAVQYPATIGEVAVVLQGKQGTGKTFFVNAFGNLFGRHFTTVTEGEQLTGKFNEHLQQSVVVFSEEALFAGNPKHHSTLKTIITGKALAVEPKFGVLRMERNYIHLIMASNSEHVIPADFEERRFFCLRVGDNHLRDFRYFDAITEQLENGGYEALMYHLLHVDLSNFIVEDFPQSIMLAEQKFFSMGIIAQFWFEILDRGHLLQEDGVWNTRVPKNRLYDEYLKFCDEVKHKSFSRLKTRKEFQLSLERLIEPAKLRTIRGRYEGQHLHCFVMPSLEDCRESFCKRFEVDPNLFTDLEYEDDGGVQADMGYEEGETPF